MPGIVEDRTRQGEVCAAGDAKSVLEDGIGINGPLGQVDDGAAIDRPCKQVWRATVEIAARVADKYVAHGGVIERGSQSREVVGDHAIRKDADEA